MKKQLRENGKNIQFFTFDIGYYRIIKIKLSHLFCFSDLAFDVKGPDHTRKFKSSLT